MKMLFFDLECSNCFGGKGNVCEFGAVLVDKNFKIIKEIAFPMSPGQGKANRFDNGFHDEEGYLKWAYDPDYYLQCDEFDHFYDQIKKLVEDEETLVFGYAVNNDVIYLNDSTERYHLPTLNYTAYDLLPIVEQYGNQQLHGLENTFYALYGDEGARNIMPHLSLDDAKMTMLVAKYLCQDLQLDILHLIEKYPSCKLNAIEYIEELRKRKAKRKKHSHTYSLCHHAWKDFCNQHNNLATSKSNDWRNVALSNSIIDEEEWLNNAINKILELQLIPRLHNEQAHYFVVNNEEEKTKIIINKSITSDKKILTFPEFIALTSDDIDNEENKLKEEFNNQ